MINVISAADIYHVKFTSYCELIACSQPILFYIVRLMYNNNNYNNSDSNNNNNNNSNNAI